ncbi:MAG: alpha/beta fold hydrolase, partial [Myxococcales bacterium]|nr:alpha/beta fold hydrolase [Myxococcales bacterium]
EELLARGYQVFTPTVDPFNTSEHRAKELIAEIEVIVEETGAPKVHIIGHSQGGLDARAVAHLRPELVASATAYGTPHHGLVLADALGGAEPWTPVAPVIDSLVRLLGKGLWKDVDAETSLEKALEQLSGEGLMAFNEAFPDQPSVRYYSIAGRTDGHAGGPDCFPEDRPPFVAQWDRERDPVDPFLALSEAFIDGGFGDPFANDGLVRVENARWGRFLGCVPADHLDQVGQLLNDSPGFGNAFDHVEFFAELIDWLHKQE